MFDFIRHHQRLMQFLLLLFIFPSFVFFGLEGYSSLSDGDNAVAKVAGQTITREEWDAAQRQQLDRLRQMAGGQIDTKVFDTPEFRRTILDNLIAQRALQAEVATDKLTVSDQLLQQSILQIPGLLKADGSFDKDHYLTLLAAQGLTVDSFQAGLRRDMALQQINAAIQGTAFAPKTVAARLSDLNEQERSVQELQFKAASYMGQVQITEAMLKEYYDQHSAAFTIPEQAKVEYVVLDSAAAAAQITVSDADMRSYYAQNIKQYSTDEQRRASHILIAVGKAASAADKAAAKAKADALVVQLRKNPGEFAMLAKANSQDPGSKDQGGDLGFFGRGAMLKPFEDAAFKMQQGDISEPVESEYGYHVILLTGVKPGASKAFDEVKAQLADQIKQQLTAKKFTEMAGIFNDTVYEQGDSLKPVADKLKLKIETAAGLTRQANPALATNAPYNHPKFLSALFVDDVIKAKHNTEVVQLAPTTLIAGRIVDYKPLAKRPLDEVKGAVRDLVMQREAMALAQKAGEAKLAALRLKDDAVGFGPVQEVSRVKTQGWRQETFQAVMKADAAQLPAFAGVNVAGAGYSVFRIVKVTQPAATDAARRQTEQAQIADALAEQEMLSYIAFVKEKAKVEILKSAVATAAAVDDTTR